VPAPFCPAAPRRGRQLPVDQISGALLRKEGRLPNNASNVLSIGARRAEEIIRSFRKKKTAQQRRIKGKGEGRDENGESPRSNRKKAKKKESEPGTQKHDDQRSRVRCSKRKKKKKDPGGALPGSATSRRRRRDTWTDALCGAAYAQRKEKKKKKETRLLLHRRREKTLLEKRTALQRKRRRRSHKKSASTIRRYPRIKGSVPSDHKKKKPRLIYFGRRERGRRGERRGHSSLRHTARGRWSAKGAYFVTLKKKDREPHLSYQEGKRQRSWPPRSALLAAP